MSPLSRRQLLAGALAGGTLAAAGAAGLWWTGRLPGAGGPSAAEPQSLASADGLLQLTLDAAPARLPIGGRQASMLAFNGTVPGPTLRLRPGDTLRVRLANHLAAPTNLHVHGLHVSPTGTGDNPFVAIEPGSTFDYEFRLPADHPPGTYWYHPHHHGHAADQVAAGLYGAILVEDRDPLAVTRDRVLVVSDLSLDRSGHPAQVSAMEQMMGREGELVLVNGSVRPRWMAAPGSRERWRIVNACPSRFLDLSLEGQHMSLLARDRGRLRLPMAVDHVELPPGGRAELLVDTAEGSSSLVALPVDRGVMPGMMGGLMGGASRAVNILDLSVSGDRVPELPAVPPGSAPLEIRTEEVSVRRTLEFAMGGMGGAMMGDGGRGMSFTINGREFDPGRTDVVVRAGAVEEWTLVNSSPMDHPVHLHVWPMQIVSGGGQDGQDGAGTWLDVVTVPARNRVTVRVAFGDFTGRTVVHCHILDHEDLGMMGTVEVR
jgi:FtsP/CotA-like multicopper oxidase with cupredoxin domain